VYVKKVININKDLCTFVKITIMSDLKLKVPVGYTEQTAYTEIHKLFLMVKLSHYKTRSFAAHEALGRTYDSLNDLIDNITEKLIGYSGIDPTTFVIGTVMALSPKELGKYILKASKKLEDYAEVKEYCDIENLAQELSGVGAQLTYLSRFS
jgi:hypothetical protein